jgi:signal transduction histidine kinase
LDKSDSVKSSTIDLGQESPSLEKIVHELSQPLTAISNYAQVGLHLVRIDSDENSEIELLFKQIGEQVMRMKGICNKIQQLSDSDGVDPID